MATWTSGLLAKVLAIGPCAQSSKRLAIHRKRALRTPRTYVCSKSKEKECRRELHLCKRATGCKNCTMPSYTSSFSFGATAAAPGALGEHQKEIPTSRSRRMQEQVIVTQIPMRGILSRRLRAHDCFVQLVVRAAEIDSSSTKSHGRYMHKDSLQNNPR
ncbi:hypothetical protein EDD17DRAFT_501057 [Pisolithus thermaeus]|nr:hypothetical protein EDD17DRAFT_501057 [Pisolithus thermaeus]